mmetsp:Transcript_28726/g.46508  ORF Transcript_28726/g.46508 Transcript_28726/m.46508 type:complete len:239 (+) Transcript_28726:734-1450(+)
MRQQKSCSASLNSVQLLLVRSLSFLPQAKHYPTPCQDRSGNYCLQDLEYGIVAHQGRYSAQRETTEQRACLQRQHAHTGRLSVAQERLTIWTREQSLNGTCAPFISWRRTSLQQICEYSNLKPSYKPAMQNLQRQKRIFSVMRQFLPIRSKRSSDSQSKYPSCSRTINSCSANCQTTSPSSMTPTPSTSSPLLLQQKYHPKSPRQSLRPSHPVTKGGGPPLPPVSQELPLRRMQEKVL